MRKALKAIGRRRFDVSLWFHDKRLHSRRSFPRLEHIVTFRFYVLIAVVGLFPVLNANAEGGDASPNVTQHQPPRPLADGAVTADWTGFLGPAHNGVSPETKLAKNWPDGGPPLVWEMETGEGFASPAIAGDRLVIAYRQGDKEIVDCVNAVTGAPGWRVRYPTHYSDSYGFNGGPRCSPVIAGERVYMYGVEGALRCIDLASGRVLWKRNLSSDFKAQQDFFGVGSTPLVWRDRLIVNVGAPGKATVVALNLDDGKTLWKAGDLWTAGYASPLPATIHGKQRVLVFCGGNSLPPEGGLMSIDPENGTVEATFPFRSADRISVNASSPVVIGDRVFLSTCYKTGGVMVELKDGGGAEKVWTTHFGAHWNTPICRDGFLYGFDGREQADAALCCLDAATGETKWRDRLEREETIRDKSVTLGPMRGSMLWADGAFLCLGETGDLSWLELSPAGAKVLAHARLFYANETYVLPVLSHGLLYVMQTQKDSISKKPARLLCYDLRSE